MKLTNIIIIICEYREGPEFQVWTHVCFGENALPDENPPLRRSIPDWLCPGNGADVCLH